MENPKNVKRSIRIPREINDKLQEMAKEEHRSVNKVIIRIIKEKVK